MLKIPSPPLRLILILPFVLQITIAVGLVGWLSFRNGQKAVGDLAKQLAGQVAERVEQELKTYIKQPQIVNQINLDLIELGYLNVNDPEALRKHFWKQIQRFNQLSLISYVSEQDEMFMVSQNEGLLRADLVLRSRPGVIQAFALDQNGNLGKKIETIPNFYPKTTPPSYRNAVLARRPIWNEIFAMTGRDLLVLSASAPCISNSGKLKGVVFADLTLNIVQDYLRGIKVGNSGQVFIIERNGALVASSVIDSPLVRDKYGRLQRMLASKSSDGILRSAISNMNSLKTLTEPKQQLINIDGSHYFLQLLPLRDEFGLNWIVGVLVNESDFIGAIEENSIKTIFLCFGALIISIGVGLMTSEWITKPISQISRASLAISQGDWGQEVPSSHIQELENLGNSFNQMTKELKRSKEQLADYNRSLEQKVIERTEELAKAKEAADEANAAKSTFLANMSHELRTPLNGILGYAQILKKQELTDEVQKGLQIIFDSGHHLLTLINDILDLSKIEASKMELHPLPFHLPTFLKSVIEIISIRATQKSIEFIHEFDPNLPAGILADEKRLRQVLLNLLGNAIKFTDRGRVTFIVRREDCKESSMVSGITFIIKDTGVGMTPAQISHLFQAFKQVGDAHRAAEGTGLGLSISQKLVHMMGGEIKVESTYNQGSSFYFTVNFPEVENLAYKPVETRDIKGYLGEIIKVLIVDDKPENIDVLVGFLLPLKFNLITATDGIEALAIAKKERPKLIITDLAMPGMDGYELIKQLRALPEFDHTKIIASSASVFQSDQERCRQLGCNGFVPKPVDLQELLDRMQALLQLQWLYEEPSTSLESEEPKPIQDIIFPETQVIENLYGYVQRGSLKKVVKLVKILEKENEQYKAFSSKVKKMTEAFQEESLLRFFQEEIDRNRKRAKSKESPA